MRRRRRRRSPNACPARWSAWTGWRSITGLRKSVAPAERWRLQAPSGGLVEIDLEQHSSLAITKPWRSLSSNSLPFRPAGITAPVGLPGEQT